MCRGGKNHLIVLSGFNYFFIRFNVGIGSEMLIFWTWILVFFKDYRILSAFQDLDDALVFLRYGFQVLKDVGFIWVLQIWIAFLGLDLFRC